MRLGPRKVLLAGGIVGPSAFIAAWALGSAHRESYDPVRQTISRLAEQGASTAPIMNAGFIAFGLCMLGFATQLRPRALRVSAAVAAAATLAVAATPLTVDGGTTVDALHYGAASVGYVAQAASPLASGLGSGPSRSDTIAPRAARSRVIGALCAALLIASVVDVPRAGLWQRAGLGVVDLWFIVLAARLLRERC